MTDRKRALVGRGSLVAACAATSLFAAFSSAADVKRGFGGGDTGVANGVNARWYYNWGSGRNTGTPTGEFVPMIWGNYSIASQVNTVKTYSDVKYLLGFNEPERTDQANTSVAQAISAWPTLMTSGKKLVSPAVSDTTEGRAWISDFMSQANANNLTVDAVAFHWYGTVDPANPEGSASGFLSRVDSYHSLYNKPIWITEFGGIDWGGAYTTAQMNEANRRFMIKIVAGLESRTYVDRYAWWHWADDTRLTDTTQSIFTPSAIGNEYIPTAVLTGETKDIAGVTQGTDNFYLRGGILTNTGAAQASAIQYLDAVDGASTIAGTSNWSIYSNALRVRATATVTKSGTNQITIDGAKLINDGTLIVSGGTLLLTNSAPVSGAGVVRLDSGAYLTLGTAADASNNTLNNALNFNGGMVVTSAGIQTLGGTTTLNASSTLNTTGGALNVFGTITGTGGLVIEGDGTTYLSKSNSYTGGTTVDGGPQGPAVLRINASNALGTGTVYFNGNSTTGRLELQGDRIVPNPINLSGRNTATPAIENILGSSTFTNTFRLQVGGGTFAIQSDAGLLTLSGTASGAGGVALNSAASGLRTVTFQGTGNGVVSGIIQNGSASDLAVIKSGAGSWTFSGSNTFSGSLSVAGGTIIAAHPKAFGTGTLVVPTGGVAEFAAGLPTAATVTAIALSGGKVDLKNNALIVNYTGASPIRSYMTSVANGYANGEWTGTGITAASAAATPGTAVGIVEASDLFGSGTGAFANTTTPDSTAVLLAYTYAGDADLSRSVDSLDFTKLVAGYGSTTGRWFTGDFNYDGSVDTQDFAALVSNFGKATIAPAILPTPGVLIPEPATAVTLLGLAGLALRRRS